MEEKKFNFWNDHSSHYLEMAFRTDKCEIIATADAYGKNTGECGDTIEMFLTIVNDRIETISFITDGCMGTQACANTVANLTEGKTVSEAWEITWQKVVDYLETLPQESLHCAELAVGTLYQALTNFHNIKQNPWKRLYPKK